VTGDEYKNEESNIINHTSLITHHASPITHYPPKGIFEMTKAALITGISGQDGAYIA